MDIVKKNILSILCGVVALVGVVVWFFPLGGMYDDLQKEVNGSKQLYTEIESLRKQPRSLPNLVLEETERQQLGRFPNDKVIAAGKQATEAMKAQSDRMIGTVTDLNKHELLVPGSLPVPRDGRTPIDFAQEYFARLGQGPDGWDAGLPAALKATMPPTPEELEQKAQEVYDEKYATQIIQIGNTNNKEDVDAQFVNEMSELQDRERRRRAVENLIYLSPEGLPYSQDISLERAARPDQMWFAQNVLWIEEDIVAAIQNANAEATNILDAPIKHLVALDVEFGPKQYVRAGSSKASSDDEGGGGAAIATDANGAPAVWSASPTGRVCNDLYDVVHFDLVLRVDARKVPQVIAALERKQMVTVLKTNVTSVDSAVERKRSGFVYGDDPVVELTLQCEILFLRSWTVDKANEGKDAVMPDDVQVLVGAKAAPAAKASDE
jgi:hypothetical protein